jgi:O-antigen/teichoic acid export membrane protein
MQSDKKDSLWLATQYIFTMISTIIILKLSISYFGQQMFGIWILLSSFWGIGNMIDLGLGMAMIKFIAKTRNSGSMEDVQRYIISGFFIYCILAVIIFIVIFNLSGLVINNSNLVPVEYKELSKILVLLLGLNFLMQYMLIFFRSILEGMTMFTLSSRLLMLYNLFLLIGILFVIFTELSIIYFALIYISASSLLLVTYIYLIRFRFKIFKFKFSQFSPGIFRNIIRYSFSLQLASIAGALIDPVIKYTIGHFATISFVSYFEIARRFTTALSGLFNTSFKNVLPKISILNTPADMESYILNGGVKLARLGVVYSGLVYGICQIILVFIIQQWFGFTESILIFILISAPEVINNYGYSLYVFLIGIGKTGILALFQFTNLVTTTAGLFAGFLIFNNYLGISGYFVSVLILNILMIVYLKKIVNLSRKEFLLKSGFTKSLLLVALILSAFTGIYLEYVSIYTGLALLSLISIVIFVSDLKKLALLLMNYGKNAVIV